MTEWISSRSHKVPELLTFHINPDEYFLTDEMHGKIDRLCYADVDKNEGMTQTCIFVLKKG